MTDFGYAPYRPVNLKNLADTPQWSLLSPAQQRGIRTVAQVYPFRTNRYVMNELIDWNAVPDDPIFRLTFPQPGMLSPREMSRLETLMDRGDSRALKREVEEIRRSLNPHPAGQLTHNQAVLDGKPLPGLQHKYEQTVLFFPSQAQTCHAFCTFCFRWAQFVGMPGLKIASKEVDHLVSYLRRHPEVSDVLITGGDPMFMGAEALSRCIDPLLEPEMEHLRNIRIGTKSVAYWPMRYFSDPDADQVLRLFERVTASGKRLALMAHYDHPRELSTPAAQKALKRIIATGAVVRVQAPLLRHINDDPGVWVSLWREAVALGAVPYYMFVARDTGAQEYFKVTLHRAWRIYRAAIGQVSGLARTVRGPSMSAHPGKVRLLGLSKMAGRTVFVLDYLQARQPELVGRPFFARFDPEAIWFDELEPASPDDKPFFPDMEGGLKLAAG
jgi:L-lysine 2,3-aminomutase